jgi:hypothetical protein
MHARLARYTFSGDAQEIARKAEEGALPIFKSLPGFKAYTIIESDDEVLSFTAWETAEQAEAANIAVADWVAENLAGDVQLVESRFGDVLLSTTLGIGTTAGARV